MKKEILLLTGFVLYALISSAQTGNERKNSWTGGGGGGFTIGYGNQDLAGLNAFMPAGLKSFSSSQTLIGGSGHGVFGRLILGGSGYAVTSSAIKTDSFKYSPAGGVGTFDIGYLVLKRRNLTVFPLFGIGGGSYGLRITRSGTVSASQVANSPTREINISHGGFVSDLSVNINFVPHPEFNEKDKSYGGFMCGLRLGYLFSIKHSDWTYAGGDISNGPDFGFNMLYVKLIFGGFGYQEKSAQQ